MDRPSTLARPVSETAGALRWARPQRSSRPTRMCTQVGTHTYVRTHTCAHTTKQMCVHSRNGRGKTSLTARKESYISLP